MKPITRILIFLFLFVIKTAIGQDTWFENPISFQHGFSPNININNAYANCFFGPQIICGDSGYIGRYVPPCGDHWENWSFIPITSKNLFSTSIIDSLGDLKTYIVGEDGVILKSDSIELDGNVPFYFLNSPTTKNLYAVHFSENTHGIAVGDSGIVIRTTDSGSHWSIINSATQNRLYALYFSSNETGYAAGTHGTIIKTTNNGLSWSIKPLSYSDTLRCVWFTDDNTGYVAGNNGAIFKTTDGGNNWWNTVSGTTKNINGICFGGNNIGYAVGNDKLVLKTTNGGSNWVIQSIPSYFHNGDYKSVCLNGGAFVVGTNRTGIINFLYSRLNEKTNKTSFLISPNPFKESFTVNYNISKESKNAVFKLYDMVGSIVYETSLNTSVHEMKVSSDKLESGLYYACIVIDGELCGTRKVIKQ